jgi:hypothetical protein
MPNLCFTHGTVRLGRYGVVEREAGRERQGKVGFSFVSFSELTFVCGVGPETDICPLKSPRPGMIS